ncbi:cobyrinate a,c-diamide synthase [Streptomyces sp. NPDC002640]
MVTPDPTGPRDTPDGRLPRIMIAAPMTGQGKTTVATGLMAALRDAGHTVSGHKTGPDYIDPGYHALATGRPGRNLDPHLVGEERVAPLLLHGARGADLAVVEGVMGLHDGRIGGDGFASTAHVAALTRTPVVLVVDISRMSRSAAAIVEGMAAYDLSVEVVGVILNKAGSRRNVAEIRRALRLPVLGVVHRDEGIAAPSRHLGLVPASERADSAEAVRRLGESIGRQVDLDAILALARSAPPLDARAWNPADEVTAPAGAARPVVAVAGGRAFTFRYAETDELLTAAGCEVVPFDPLTDTALPSGTRGLYLGGGFPEVYAAELAANRPLMAEIREAVRAGVPTVAECAGLLYLAETLDDTAMAGAVPAHARMAERLTLRYPRALSPGDTLLTRAGERVTGHEFHRTVTAPAASAATPAWEIDGLPEGFASPSLHASYLHVHWAGHPRLAQRFAAAATGTAAAPVPGPRSAAALVSAPAQVSAPASTPAPGAGEATAAVVAPATPEGGLAAPSRGLAAPAGSLAAPAGSLAAPAAPGGGLAAPVGGLAASAGSPAAPAGSLAAPAAPGGGLAAPVGGLAAPVVSAGNLAAPEASVGSPAAPVASASGLAVSPGGRAAPAAPAGALATPVADPLRHHGDVEARDGLLDLAVNVYSGERPDWLERALRAGIAEAAAYPDPEPARRAVARRHGRPPAEALPTAGAAEAFTLVARLRPWRRPVVVHPQFTEPHAALEQAGHTVTTVLCRDADGFALDPAAVPEDADLVVVGNPTNPTGVLHPAAAVRALRRRGRLVVVDEAFMDAVPGEPESLADDRSEGLLVIRSLTKHWSIPGIRAGYVVGDPAVVGELARAQTPWALSSPAVAATVACTAPQALPEADTRARLLTSWREYLQDGLADAGVPFVPSAAPFVLARPGEGVHGLLRAHGVAARRADTFPGLDPSWIRLAVRPPETTRRFLDALAEVRACAPRA